jgi:hypothetical protein
MKSMTLSFIMIGLLLFLLPGCATKMYDNAKTGESADLQELLAKSIEEAFASIPEEIWSHRISLEIAAPRGDGRGLSPYIRQHLTEKINSHGGTLESPHEVYMRVVVPASGTLITERRLSLTANVGGIGNLRLPIFYGETFKGLTRTLIFCRDEEGRLQQVLRGEQKKTSHEIYWFWVVGPFETNVLPQF